ncbi:hypothetical protein ACFORJ_07770 [Corynebacterium hansenii]|uniref:Uncharacterized protein n=1 Tax=Corynebacterium hansenii TaxID=394964 RepID=A0ABV7ZPE7_9CORY|nr:hypothetical protein [Corynebacterium hansenii]WJZ00646.1 hypothetical protein CHAN_10225 [Corynebacterium hansenii]
MPGFLIEYNRLTGAVDCTQFPSIVEATIQRMMRDVARVDSNVEIVAVTSPNRESLEHSHSRYFARREDLTLA